MFKIKKLKQRCSVGDVLLLSNGRLTRLVSPVREETKDVVGYFMLQFVDRSGETFQSNDGTLDIEKNLGQSSEVLTHFYAAASIHRRLTDAKGLFSET